jgi:hypothetical protein
MSMTCPAEYGSAFVTYQPLGIFLGSAVFSNQSAPHPVRTRSPC